MRLRRRRSTLAFNEAMFTLTGRQSVATWRRRCEASLRASRRRRGLR
jgi:hypothetical protein